MDDKAMQRWGVIVGGACLAAALGAATLTAPRVGSAPVAPSATETSAPGPAEPSALPAPIASPDPVLGPIFEPAGDAAPPATVQAVSFLVRFEGAHPLAQAQSLEARGQHAAAVRAANQAVRTRSELRGLCFDRFTLGGAEVVLESCTNVPAPQQASFVRRWHGRLSAMPGVDYAEPNVVAQPERN